MVIAAGKGKVVWAGYGIYYGAGNANDPYGLAVSIEHDFGYQGKKLYTIYAHLDRIDVIVGQQVETGTNLGVVGMTGNTTGPHLHFEVRVEDNSFYTTRNPELWIVPPQGWGVLAGDFRNKNGSFLNQQSVKIRAMETGQRWEVITYGTVAIHKDDYYTENLVIGDLPAGDYEAAVDYLEETYICQFSIVPGGVTYITFRGEVGCGFILPSTPNPETWLE
jgi:murein DD-endopeptidase MepM/ murein hydrolase activator NlpD